MAGTDLIRSPLALEVPPETAARLLAILEHLLPGADLDRALTEMARGLRDIVPYDTFAVLLLDQSGRELRFRHTVGYPGDVAGQWRFAVGQGIAGTAVSTRRPIRVEDHGARGVYESASVDMKSELAIPLLVGDQVLGVLDVGSGSAARFGPEDEACLTLLAAHLALVIDHERRFAALEDQAQSLSVLHEVSRELTSTLDFDTLIARLAALVCRVADHDQLTFLLWNEETAILDGILTVTHGKRRDHHCSFGLGHGITGATAALRHPIRVPNVRLDPRFVFCGGDLEIASELAVPILYKDRLLGVIDLESSRLDAFTPRHEEMLVTLAACVGVALENARLYAALLDKDRLLESDLAAAREIQRGLLPPALPRVPGLDVAVAYEPARALGGDFYDFLSYDADRLAVAVGDVAGKSTGAALLAALTVGTMREHVVSHRCPPAEMLRDLNDHLQRFRVEGRFVALAFGTYERPTRRLTLANSGFPRPHLLRDGEVREIGVNGVPLALLAGMEYEEDVRELRPGDTVVFASDGIEECMNPAGEHFGVEGLRPLLGRLARGSAEDIAKGIIEATDAYAGGGESSDDRTVVVLRVTS